MYKKVYNSIKGVVKVAYVEPEVLIQLFNEGIVSKEEYEVQIEENYDILNSEVVKVVKKTIRKNISMSKEVAAWIEERAEKYGITQSSVVVMAIADYIKQDKAMEMMSNSGSILKQLEEVQSNIKK